MLPPSRLRPSGQLPNRTRLAVATGEASASRHVLTRSLNWQRLSLCPVCFDDATVLASVKAKPFGRGKGRGLDLRCAPWPAISRAGTKTRAVRPNKDTDPVKKGRNGSNKQAHFAQSAANIPHRFKSLSSCCWTARPILKGYFRQKA